MLIDLRSDTVTKPSSAMLQAMINAKVGDDVFSEDPTVIELEKLVASLFKKESALFCASGTMANQIAIKCHTQPGDEVICDNLSHVYNYEGGGIAFLSGASVKLINSERGIFSVQQITEAINPEHNVHFPISRLVVIENTCNKGGGSVWRQKDIQEIKKVCDEKKLKLHLDGARLFNALTETKESTLEYGKLFDSISICLSKGLGAPIGSVLVGDNTFITKARRIRKVLGGGMRQAGYLAAAGIYALENNIERLKDDHSRAKEIEQLLLKLSFIESVKPVETNIVLCKVSPSYSSEKLLEKLKEKNVLLIEMGNNTIRAVTHLDFSDTMLKQLTSVLKKI